MNILGVGNLELIWILLLALVLLGPGRMVDAARTMGKFWREAQHVLRATADAATVSLDAPPPRRAPSDPIPAPEDAVARDDSGDAEVGEQPDAAPQSGVPQGDGDESPEAR